MISVLATFQGVGYPLDIVVCSALGADMYDCVYPTRTARFGTALVPEVMSCLESFWELIFFNLVPHVLLLYFWFNYEQCSLN